MSLFDDTTDEIVRREVREELRSNLRRRIAVLKVEIGTMEERDQKWKGKYHELVGERKALEQVEEGNYD
jgi:hypothetical protein